MGDWPAHPSAGVSVLPEASSNGVSEGKAWPQPYPFFVVSGGANNMEGVIKPKRASLMNRWRDGLHIEFEMVGTGRLPFRPWRRLRSEAIGGRSDSLFPLMTNRECSGTCRSSWSGIDPDQAQHVGSIGGG